MKRTTRFILLITAILVMGNVKVLAQLIVAAPSPPAYTSAKEISIFSAAFSNVGNINFNPIWGQGTVGSIIQIESVNTLQLTNFDYQGIELGNHINAASMKFLHLDVWTADETSLQITPISPGSPANMEYLVEAPPLVLNQWNSIDIPLSSFVGVALNDIFQIKIVGSGNIPTTTKKTICIENLYFYDNDPTPDVLPPTDFTATIGVVTPGSVELLLNATDNSGAVNYTINYGSDRIITGGYSGVQTSYIVKRLNTLTDYSFSVGAIDMADNAAANTIILTATTPVGFTFPSANLMIPVRTPDHVISIYGYNGYTMLPTVNLNTKDTLIKKTIINTFHVDPTHIVMQLDSFNFQRIEFGTTINAVTMDSVHVDIYTANETSISVQLLMTTSGGNAVALTPLLLNTWNSYNIPLSSFGVNTSTLSQFEFLNGSGGKTFYMDNLYLFTDNIVITDVAKKATTMNGIKCYPQLVMNQLTVKADSPISQITIRNLLGQSVKTVLINSFEGSIDLSYLSSGNYLVVFKMANNQQETQKIVKL